MYIRFVLEAYLELSLSSMLRFQNFTFDTASERFHSVVATIIFLCLIAFLLFALVYLQWKFPILATKEANQRFGDLYLGLRTKERSSLVSPVIFLLRRILYAYLLVSWTNRSYFQI